MKTNNLFTLPLMALAATALTSCWDDDEKVIPEPIDPNAGKELVAFSSTGGEAVTRAGFSETATTTVAVRIKSVDTQTTNSDGSTHTPGAPRYTMTYLTGTPDVAADHEETDDIKTHYLLNEKHSDLSFSAIANKRYWDDAYGRHAKLSVYAVAVPGETTVNLPLATKDVNYTTESSNIKTVVDADNNPNWFTEQYEDEYINWQVSTTQDATSVSGEDLCYSNNIKDGGKSGVYKFGYNASTQKYAAELVHGQMMWRAQTIGSTTGKFDLGNLIFHHGLCQVTISLKEGEGFDSSIATDFQFTSGNITMLQFPTEGKLDIEKGKWDTEVTTIPSAQRNDITSMYDVTPSAKITDGTEHVYNALCLPGLNLFTETGNAFKFTIDKNEYFVTYKNIADKIRDYYKDGGGHFDSRLAEFETMTQGDHYQISITVNKTGIKNITAKVVDWVTVNAENVPATNARVEINFEDHLGTEVTSGLSIYRSVHTDTATPANDEYTATDWDKDYSLSRDAKYENGKWTTEWYWENNLTSYHLRTLSPTGQLLEGNSSKTYVSMTSGSTLTDYQWGAPFKEQNATDDKCQLLYDKAYGYSASDRNNALLNPAIGPTSKVINMTLFHMMAQVQIVVKTTDNDDKVVLYNTETTKATKITIRRFSKTGKLDLGDGLVTTTNATYSDQDVFATPTTGLAQYAISQPYSYAIIPQELKRTGDEATSIGLVIETPDGNEYIIEDLSTLKIESIATTNPQNNRYTVNDVIDFWYPGYIYKYTVILRKTGIQNITAQLVDWETVTGDLGEITLEGTN